MYEKVFLKKDILKKYWIYSTIRSLYFLLFMCFILISYTFVVTCMLTSWLRTPDLPAFASQMLRLQVNTTIPNFNKSLFKMKNLFLIMYTCVCLNIGMSV